MPKHLGHLWQDIVRFDNLLQAYRQARRGKQQRQAVAADKFKDLGVKAQSVHCK